MTTSTMPYKCMVTRIGSLLPRRFRVERKKNSVWIDGRTYRVPNRSSVLEKEDDALNKAPALGQDRHSR
jgi:hypothetical protein